MSKNVPHSVLNNESRDHVDVMARKRFPHYWPFGWRIYGCQWMLSQRARNAEIISLLLAWTHFWTNNRDTDDFGMPWRPCDGLVIIFIKALNNIQCIHQCARIQTCATYCIQRCPHNASDNALNRQYENVSYNTRIPAPTLFSTKHPIIHNHESVPTYPQTHPTTTTQCIP